MRMYLSDISKKALRWKYGARKYRVTASGILEVVIGGTWSPFAKSFDDFCDKIRELQEEYLSKIGNVDYYRACFGLEAKR